MALLALQLALLTACSSSSEGGPTVTIFSPEAGASYAAGDEVQLVGEVQDPDGLVDVDTVTWSSDRDGELGVVDPSSLGRVTLATPLSAGAHTLRLAATDFSGLSDYEEVPISVAGYPVATIAAPEDGAQVLVGDEVTLAGTVSDPDQDPASLSVTWSYRADGGTATPLPADPPSSDGATTTTWAPPEGSFTIELRVTDQGGLSSSDSRALHVVGTEDFDADDDGFAPSAGDCDDDDPAVHPGAPEVCGNGIDDDCNDIADDKDADGDGFFDEACDIAGAVDCNDDSANVHLGHAEVPDDLDNNCDGVTDEGTERYDDDGDCHCEDDDTCNGGIRACDELKFDDCNDDAVLTYPGAPDEPDPPLAGDPALLDTNCDTLDGTIAGAVFVAPGGDDDANCGFSDPCRTVTAVIAKMENNLLPIYAQAGLYAGAITAPDGLTIHGGYASNWTGPRHDPSATVIEGGLAPAGADVAYLTLWADGAEVNLEQLTLQGPDVTARDGRRGQSSYVVHASGSTLTLERVVVLRGSGADGLEGAFGADRDDPADAGSRGDHGCQGCATDGGSGGQGTCPSTGGGPGGDGGPPDAEGDDGQDGDAASGTLGQGGSGGPFGAATCPPGFPGSGSAGRNGADGSGGSAGSGGTWSAGDWIGESGGAGYDGISHGGGGGGGGGAGGCTQFNGPGDRDQYTGGGGGGGGAGGCRSTNPGGGGGAGGASVGIYAFNTDLYLTDVVVTGGLGGDGGAGGHGGAGQPGGARGNGGASTAGTRAGGRGGPGGDGGDAGGGGGGAGGWVFGLVREGSTQTFGNVEFEAGDPGAGGAPGPSAGHDGQRGIDGKEDDIVSL